MTTKFLIVDDDLDTIRLMGDVLRGTGDLFFATNGAAAIRTAHEKNPDIVLLDAEMPELDGFEVCTALKADPATADASVIFVTAHSDIEREERALRLGAVDFISKPISPPIVRARVLTHITLKAQADELRRQATIDHLTGLPNRRAFDEVYQREWRRARRGGYALAALMIDLDCFKQFNDTYGHPAGDACLRAVAHVLDGCAQRPGDFAARYGGEEFVILLPDTADLDGGIRFAETVCAAVRALGIQHAQSLGGETVTTSVGVSAVVPQAGVNAASLVLAADQALYEAKRSGRNRVRWMVP